MSIRFLVVDADAAMLLHSAIDPAGDWFESFGITDPQGRVRSFVHDNGAIIASAAATSRSKLLVVDLKEENFFLKFPAESRREILRRLLVGAQCTLSKSISIPQSWRPFNHGSRISFHAMPFSASKVSGNYASRIEFDRNAFGTGHVYAFNCSSEWNDLKGSVEDKVVFDRAVASFLHVVANRTALIAPNPVEAPGAISLTEESYFHSENNIGFEEWIDSRLTSKQKSFVAAPDGTPIRLRGAAGTGKTLALTVRLLDLMRRSVEAGVPRRILFLTHSASTCGAIEALLDSLDRRGIRLEFLDLDGAVFQVRTMLDLALEAVGADLESSGILPLATDAQEGRQLQIELIESEFKAFLASADWLAIKGICSETFRQYASLASAADGLRRFAWELMNEFACVLDADGIRQKPEQRQRYLREARQAWMLPLPVEADRTVVLLMYDRFVRLVSEMSAISVDQLVADYLNYLDSFRWNAVRDRRGFDVVFVDELHLFNRQERMVFQGLSRNELVSGNLYLAYDAKQAPADTFMAGESRESERSVWAQLKVAGIQKVELDKVFRYSPEIAAFVSRLDESYPALELGEDWGQYSIESVHASARVPTACTLLDEKEVYRNVFKRAHDLKRRGGQRYSVAVLCCNPDNFATFRDAGDLREYFRPVSSREEAAGARPDAYRFLLSTPEYVAGLQFDAVFLLDVNRGETPEGAYSAGLRRRFISKVYLGSSRAQSHLELYSSQTSGGLSPLMDRAIASSALQVSQWKALVGVAEIVP